MRDLSPSQTVGRQNIRTENRRASGENNPKQVDSTGYRYLAVSSLCLRIASSLHRYARLSGRNGGQYLPHTMDIVCSKKLVLGRPHRPSSVRPTGKAETSRHVVLTSGPISFLSICFDGLFGATASQCTVFWEHARNWFDWLRYLRQVCMGLLQPEVVTIPHEIVAAFHLGLLSFLTRIFVRYQRLT